VRIDRLDAALHQRLLLNAIQQFAVGRPKMVPDLFFTLTTAHDLFPFQQGGKTDPAPFG